MVASIVSLSSLNGSDGFRLDGAAAGDVSGRSVSNAGDVNGDGFDDVIVGALGADPNGISGAGSSYVVFGKASGFSAAMNLSNLNGSNGFRLDGVTAYDGSGSSVSNAGDVNGDGFDDVIIGASRADSNGIFSGSSYVVFGKASGFSATMNLSDLDGNTGFRLDGATESDQTGISVSSAGDINGDGLDDLIIGATGSNYYEYGAVPVTSGYVVFGKATGFSPTLNLSSLNGSNGFYLNVFSETGRAESKSVSSAGDVNGDGYDDLIVGMLFPSPHRDANNGIAEYVVFGKASGFDTAIDLSSLDGSDGFLLEGTYLSLYDDSGPSVSSAGDINGDGFDDLIVGTRSDYDAGQSYVVFGKATGFSPTLNVSSLDGSNGFRLHADPEFSDYLGESVSGAGDVNGDGFDDLIVGAPIAKNASGDYSGVSYVVYGKASGFTATLNLSSLDGNDGFRLDGVAVFDRSGTSVSNAGDVNGDGVADLIVGSYGAGPNGLNSGSSYVVFGRSNSSGEKVIQGTPGNDMLTGTGTWGVAERFEAGDGDDRMIGRGGADVFHGGEGNDYMRISDPGFVWVDGGVGTDTLALGGSGWNLDLADVGGKISSIETISLFGNGDNTLTLTAAALLNLSDTTNTLRVNGGVGDRVIGLSQDWEDGGIQGNHHRYTNDEAILLVGVNVATDFV